MTLKSTIAKLVGSSLILGNSIAFASSRWFNPVANEVYTNNSPTLERILDNSMQVSTNMPTSTNNLDNMILIYDCGTQAVANLSSGIGTNLSFIGSSVSDSQGRGMLRYTLNAQSLDPDKRVIGEGEELTLTFIRDSNVHFATNYISSADTNPVYEGQVGKKIGRMFMNHPTNFYIYNVLEQGKIVNDAAIANSGQLKQGLSQAAIFFDDSYPGGRGTNVQNTIDTFSSSNNFFALNMGQAYNASKPFYDRLAQVSTNAPSPPWTGSNANHYAAMRVGGLKRIFKDLFTKW